MAKIVLASSSPRRKELLEQIGIDFEISASNVDENISYHGDPDRYVEQLALIKAQSVARRVSPGSLVIGADTIVLYDKKILGKPKDNQDAFNTIKTLSGKKHMVFTGIAVIQAPEEKTVVSYEKTEVKFREIDDAEIAAYIESGEHMDKAGSYGIQGKAAVFVESIDGCFFNVVGLPISKLGSMLKTFGVSII